MAQTDPWLLPTASPQAAPRGGMGVEIPKAPKEPDLPSPTRATERWRTMTPAEIKAQGLQEGQRYQINEAGKIEPITSKEMTEGESKAVGFYQRMRSADTQLNRLGLDPQGFSTLIAQRISPDFSRAALSDERRAQLDAMENFIAASLRLESGAAIGPDEFAKQARIFFPQPGAGQNEIDTKKQQRELAILGFKAVAGETGARRADENLRNLGFIDENGLPIVKPSPAAGGGAPPAVAPIKAGEAYQTEADLAAQKRLQDAWNSGLSVDDMIALNQQMGRGAFAPEDIARMRDARTKGGPISFYATPTGQPTAAEGVIGAALSTPVGEAVGGYTMGAANALTAGMLDELAPILGLDAGRVQAAKDYLRTKAPVSSFAGEVTGGIIGALPAIKGAQALTAGTKLAGAAPLIGETLYGAGYGAGEAPTGERGIGALIGGGAALGGGALANRFLPGGPGTWTGAVPEVPAGAVIPEVPPVAAMAPEVAPAAPVAQAAPSMAPEMPPVAAAIPEAAAAAPMAAEEMITLAQKAVSRTPGASKARAQLADMAKTNPEAKAAADRLGIELPVDVLSDNAQLKEVTGLTRAQIGSEAKQAWNETVSAASERAHQAMDELDAVTDISQVSADVFDRLDKAQMGLGKQASNLRQEVTDAVDVRGRVDAAGIKGWLEGRIADLGGGKEGIANLSPEEKRLWGIVSKGQPTYALINEQRDLIGQALEKGTGPWSNTNMKRLKDIYGALANDQINFIEASAGKEIADKQRAANTLFKQMYEGREQMERIFTKNLSGSLAPLMQRAITQGAKGNAQTLNTLVKIIPEDMRGKVLTSALFKAAKATDETFSFTNFANIYRDLRANGAVYKEFAKAVGPEGDKLLTDLYAISRRLSDADKAISRTGASTQLNLLNSERLLSRILMASGGAAGAGLIGSVLGGPGAAIVGAGLAAAAPEIAQRVGKTNAQKLHNLMSSTEFRELATSAATGDALDRNINRVAGSSAFRDFAKTIGLELKQGRNWLRSAMTAGAVGEVGPEAGPPEGAIMVRPQ